MRPPDGMPRRMIEMASLGLLVAVSLLACEPRPVFEEFEIGMARAELRERFGEPALTEELVKNVEHIFGPIETFWSDMEAGDRVEIWSYPTPGGHVQLYFLNGSDTVSGKGFNDENAVY